MIKPWVFQFFNAPAEPGVLVPRPRDGVTPSEAAAHFNEYWQGIKIPRDEFIIGTPAQVAEQIIDQCRATGAGHFVARIEGHGDARDERRAFDLFGREVVPLLRRAGAGNV